MTQEDKELLLKDLSARLSYGVFCVGTTYDLDDDGENYIPVKVKNTLTEIHNHRLGTSYVKLGFISSCRLETVKPYLRLMSSMTEEEINEYKHLVAFSGNPNGAANFTDWLNKNIFDYRGLIEKGLALEAPEDMYK